MCLIDRVLGGMHNGRGDKLLRVREEHTCWQGAYINWGHAWWGACMLAGGHSNGKGGHYHCGRGMHGGRGASMVQGGIHNGGGLCMDGDGGHTSFGHEIWSMSGSYAFILPCILVLHLFNLQ